MSRSTEALLLKIQLTISACPQDFDIESPEERADMRLMLYNLRQACSDLIVLIDHEATQAHRAAINAAQRTPSFTIEDL